MEDIANIFGITYPYEQTMLKNAYTEKHNNIKNNHTLTNNDKQVLSRYYHKIYTLGKQRHNSIPITYATNYSYTSNMTNGNKIVAETSTYTNNNKTVKNERAFSVDNNGKRQTLNYNDAIKQMRGKYIQ